MEARPNEQLNPLLRIQIFGAFMCIVFSTLTNVILGAWLILTVNLNIVVIIFITSSYVLFYFRYVLFYSFNRSSGVFGRNYFNCVDIQIFKHKLFLI